MRHALFPALFSILVACGAKEVVISPADGSSSETSTTSDASGGGDAQAETSTASDSGMMCTDAGAPDFACGNIMCDSKTQYCLVKGHGMASTCENLTCACAKNPDCNCITIPCMGGQCQGGGGPGSGIIIACP